MIRSSRWPRTALAVFLLAPCLLACSEQETGGAAPTTPTKPTTDTTAGDAPKEQAAAAPTRAELYDRGRGVYLSNCTACHNMNPSQPGSLGPAVEGSSRELLHARIIDGTYPPGYTPKRDSKLMVPLPHLAGDIDALTVYLSGKK